MEKQSKSISKNFLYLLLFIFLLFNSNTFGREKTIDKNESINKTSSTNVGDIIVKKWAGDKKSALSFSFDDSYQTHYINVRPILNQFGFLATFYLAADFINDDHPAEWRYGVWPQFLEMAQEGHEMAAHTMTHPHLPQLDVGNKTTPGTIEYELYQSKKIIEEKIGQDVISMAYPYNQHNSTIDNIANLYYINSRAGGSQPNSSSIFGNQWYDLTAKEPEFHLPRNTMNDDLDELIEYKNYLLSSINNEKWTIFFGHEVLPFANMVDSLEEMYLPISNEWLLTFTQWVKDKSDNNDIWVETVGNVTRYIKERDNFSFNVVSNSSNQIIIDVGDGLDDNIYNYPLTTDIIVPNNWGNVVFTQGNATETLTPFTNNGVNYVRANIIPSAGNVIVENSESLFTITSSAGVNGSITPLGVTSINSGGSQPYTITPNTGYKIDSITVDGNPETVTSESGQTYTFTNVTANHTISATFSIIQYTITSSAGANGSITTLCVTLINSGESQPYTITPNTGYKIDSITVDGNPETVTTPSGQSYTFLNVTAHHSISASFSVIVTSYTFSGKVTYNNSANSPLANVTLKLTSSSSTIEASTNSSGEFQFNNLLPGSYQITLTTTNAWGGVNATDALRTVRVFANLDTFTDLQKKAGDVNNDGSINSTDALLMIRRFAGLISSFSIQDWVFDVPASITITSQNESVNIKALAVGDVDGSLIP